MNFKRWHLKNDEKTQYNNRYNTMLIQLEFPVIIKNRVEPFFILNAKGLKKKKSVITLEF